jgi:hypothetical protein
MLGLKEKRRETWETLYLGFKHWTSPIKPKKKREKRKRKKDMI